MQSKIGGSRHLGGKNFGLGSPLENVDSGMGRTIDGDQACTLVDIGGVSAHWRVFVRSFVAGAVCHVVLDLAQVGGTVPPWRLNVLPSEGNHQKRCHIDGQTQGPSMDCQRKENGEGYA